MRGSVLDRTGAALAALLMASAIALPAAAQMSGADAEETAAELEQLGAGAAAVDSDADPLEGFNRQSFKAYLFIDDVILVPASTAYRAVTPAKGRKGIRKFLDNANTPAVLVNDLLQGEFKRAGVTTGRFIINSTIGFFGFADPAEKLGLPDHSEDFGQTLAVWGVPEGPFLMLPLFGPTTLRDTAGIGADMALDPLMYIDTDAARRARLARFPATAVSRREPLIEPLDDIQAKSLDYYASLRSFYLQARKREIANGRTSYDDLPDIGDFEEFDDLE